MQKSRIKHWLTFLILYVSILFILMVKFTITSTLGEGEDTILASFGVGFVI